MVALIIVASILVLLALIIFLIKTVRLRVVLECEASTVMYAKILFIKLPIYPDEEDENKKYTSLTPKKIKKLEKEGDEDVIDKASEIEKKKRKKKNGKKNNRKKSSESTEADALLSFAKDVLRGFFTRENGKFKIVIRRFILSIGDESPDRTAYLFTAAQSSLASFIEFLRNNTELIIKDNRRVAVIPNFIQKGVRADISMEISLTIWQIIASFIPIGE